ncbi:hypothetical protein DAI22_06g286600 [Oryza sativa Japonica Group]|nr:hypothetical protein DAI22_06g286600 [Oryza sativa Japonica Group]
MQHSAVDSLLSVPVFFVPRHPCCCRMSLLHHYCNFCANTSHNGPTMKPNFCNLPMSRLGGFSGQVILPLAHTFEPAEFLEVIKLGNTRNYQDTLVHRDLFLLQMYNGVEESSAGTCSELIFAPIDASFSDDSPLLPSGFYIIPIDSPLTHLARTACWILLPCSKQRRHGAGSAASIAAAVLLRRAPRR